MDDSLVQQFFLAPQALLQRRYEILRAFFVERRPMTEIAQQFRLGHGTVRNLVCDFRAQCQAGQATPFFRSPPAVAPPPAPTRRREPRLRTSLTAICFP